MQMTKIPIAICPST